MSGEEPFSHAWFGADARFDHVAHGTRSILSLLPIYRDLLGGTFVGGGDNDRVGFRYVQLAYRGGGRVELIQPLTGSSFLDSFFGRVGDGGLHHMTFKVPDIHRAVESARAHGLEPFSIFTEDRSWQEAFLHPRITGGALIQLACSPFDPSQPYDSPPMSIEAFAERGGPPFGP